ncbi:MAG: tRNA glutamyl-Q(34) synthetase GluQRS [Akkermansiaceae bacterium]|nr:tRNA glutamyl-Q(34) synthetase GluQRS [Akkermansiaceae bacterium]
MIVTRFAPSPTGRLHLGHVHAAKVARDLARSENGRFLLRFEDIDHTRSRPEYRTGIEEDLHWLGLDWDGVPIDQSQRTTAYAEALEQLQSGGLAYPCFCTRREIETEIGRMLHAPHGPEGALYPGTCRSLSPQRRKELLASGIAPAWRLDSARAAAICGDLTFQDLRFGRIPVTPQLLGDVVLARKDIGTSYHLAVVVDDAWQEITHVTRGEDLLPSTHVHRLLQTLLGLPAPQYLHHTLITDEKGVRLAKRHDSLSIATLREQKHTPAEILSMLPASGD